MWERSRKMWSLGKCQTFPKNTKVQCETKVTVLFVLQKCENQIFFSLDKKKKTEVQGTVVYGTTLCCHLLMIAPHSPPEVPLLVAYLGTLCFHPFNFATSLQTNLGLYKNKEGMEIQKGGYWCWNSKSMLLITTLLCHHCKWENLLYDLLEPFQQRLSMWQWQTGIVVRWCLLAVFSTSGGRIQSESGSLLSVN